MDWLNITWTFLTYGLTTIGVWKIFEKCGEKGYWALVPGYRYYRMGQVCGSEENGLYCMVFEILAYFVSIGMEVTPEESNAGILLTLLYMVAHIPALVFEIRVELAIIRTFDKSRWWILPYIVFPGITSMIFGFHKDFVPVNLGRYDDDILLPGRAPADLSAAVDDDESDDGLVVHVKARTVKDLNITRYLLKDINLTIPNGSLVLLLGGSGAGKTTLVNAIIGYEPADALVKLNGEDIYKNYEQMKYRIGFVPQQDLLRGNDTMMNTLHDAALLRLPKEMSAQEMKEKIDNVIDVLGLNAGQDGLVSKKSGGQKKRISIGTELISDPDLFILDEPDSGLDGVIARELYEKLRLIADNGKIVIAITHTPDRVADLFDKVIVLAKDSGKVGRLAYYGSPKDAKKFFGKKSMEQIVMAINSKEEGGEGRADEFIEKYAKLTGERGGAGNE
ncbi:MAG: ABC transporter ATP-binding protein [Solobacterium sp.]|nr:ABC transporter ATP-binding protein [Solobacterium sp.]